MKERLLNDGRFQAHWYEHVARMGYTGHVLDVGAGSGYGMEILGLGMWPRGIDPMPTCPRVSPCRIEDEKDNSSDVVVSMDVIEHVEDDDGFLRQLLRVASWSVFFSTPNYNVTECANVFHIREYTPAELRDLLGGLNYQVWVSDAGCIVEPRASIEDGETAPNFGILVSL